MNHHRGADISWYQFSKAYHSTERTYFICFLVEIVSLSGFTFHFVSSRHLCHHSNIHGLFETNLYYLFTDLFFIQRHLNNYHCTQKSNGTNHNPKQTHTYRIVHFIVSKCLFVFSIRVPTICVTGLTQTGKKNHNTGLKPVLTF